MRKSRFIPISLLSLETSLTVFLRPVTERRYDVHPKLMFYVNYISTEKKEGGHQWTHTSLNCDFLQGLTVSGSKLRLVLVTSHTLLQPFQPIVFSELKAAWQSLLVAQCGDKGGQRNYFIIKIKNRKWNWLTTFLLGFPWWSKWLRLHAAKVGSPGSIPGQGQIPHAATKSPHMAMKMPSAQHSQKNLKIKLKRNSYKVK